MAPNKEETKVAISAEEGIINEWNKKYQSEEADMTIKSSDNLIFRVHSYRMMAASKVFRDMIQIGSKTDQAQEIPLTDQDIETSTVVSLFLDITYAFDMPEPKDCNDFDKDSNLVTFSIKYEAQPAIQYLGKLFYSWVSSGKFRSDLVLVEACRLDDPSLGGAAIAAVGHYPHMTQDSANSGGMLQLQKKADEADPLAKDGYNCDVMDPLGMSLSRFQSLSDRYKLALLRGCQSYVYTRKPQPDWKSASQSFEKYVRKVK
ncbi:uncharacterized protein L201_007327 [Kwoniella dendrophila CBS 6074]|uniref:BTB domain-containing protein n=1 Tax=Kwoniella dendrophila CBS 6074 TaxID=1295534 RepID=A0AAX4K6C2_9TREE